MSSGGTLPIVRRCASAGARRPEAPASYGIVRKWCPIGPPAARKTAADDRGHPCQPPTRPGGRNEANPATRRSQRLWRAPEPAIVREAEPIALPEKGGPMLPLALVVGLITQDPAAGRDEDASGLTMSKPVACAKV